MKTPPSLRNHSIERDGVRLDAVEYRIAGTGITIACDDPGLPDNETWHVFVNGAIARPEDAPGNLTFQLAVIVATEMADRLSRLPTSRQPHAG